MQVRHDQQTSANCKELSFERPSCYYEVGYLQALINKTVNLICKTGTSMHKVLNRENLMTYSDLDNYRLTIEKILNCEACRS